MNPSDSLMSEFEVRDLKIVFVCGGPQNCQYIGWECLDDSVDTESDNYVIVEKV